MVLPVVWVVCLRCVALVEAHLLFIRHIAVLLQVRQRHLLCHNFVPPEVLDLALHLTYYVIFIVRAQVVLLQQNFSETL